MSYAIAAEAKTVLLVQDHKHAHDRVRQILEVHGYAVLDVPDGEQLLRIVDEHRGDIDLILSDLTAPRMSGVQLLEELSSRAPQANVLFMSACADSSILQPDGLNSTFALLRTPFTPGELLAKVEEMLANPRSQEDLLPPDTASPFNNPDLV